MFGDYSQDDNHFQSLGKRYAEGHLRSWQNALGDTGEGHFFNWSGGNNSAERKEAAAQLAFSIMQTLHKDPSKTVNIVAHSHGGNVAIMALNTLANAGINTKTVVMMGTPSRAYKLTDTARRHIQTTLNLYNKYDGVQTNGGSTRRFVGGDRLGNPVYTGGFEIGPAGRAHGGFDNRDVTDLTGLKSVQVPIYAKGRQVGYRTQNPGIWDAHGAMHTNQNVMNFVHQYLVHRGLAK